MISAVALPPAPTDDRKRPGAPEAGHVDTAVLAALQMRPAHERKGFSCGGSDSMVISCRAEDVSLVVVSTATVTNRQQEPLELAFDLPMPVGAAVTDMWAVANGLRVQSFVKTRRQAEDTYDDAIASGDRAFLVSQDAGHIRVSLGNLEPGAEASVTVTYSAAPVKTDPDGGRLWFALPSPSPDAVFDIPDGYERASKPGGVVVGVDCPLPPADTAALFADPDRDAAALSLALAIPRRLAASQLLARSEVVVVADLSGSMTPNIGFLREALRDVVLTLRGRPGVAFNVLFFGSRYRELFAQPASAADEQAVAQALECFETVVADMGGTNLYDALTHACGQPLPEGATRELLVVTDGQWNNPDRTVGLASRQFAATRFSCIGLGPNADFMSLQALAQAGHGTAEVTFTGKETSEIALRQTNRSLEPVLVGARLSLELPGFELSAVDAALAPLRIGQTARLAVLVSSSTDQSAPAPADLEAEEGVVHVIAADDSILLSYGVVMAGASPELVSRAAAAHLASLEGLSLGVLEDDAEAQERVKVHALRFGLTSSQTSRVCTIPRPVGEPLIDLNAAAAARDGSLDCDSDSDDDDGGGCGCGVGGAAPPGFTEAALRSLAPAALGSGLSSTGASVPTALGFAAVEASKAPPAPAGEEWEHRIFSHLAQGPRNRFDSCWMDSAVAFLAAVPALRDGKLHAAADPLLAALGRLFADWARSHALKSSLRHRIQRRTEALRREFAARGFSADGPESPLAAVALVLRLAGVSIQSPDVAQASVVLCRVEAAGEAHFVCFSRCPSGAWLFLDDTLNLRGQFQGGVLTPEAAPAVTGEYFRGAVLTL